MSATKLQFTDDQFIDGLRSGNNELLSALYKKHYNTVLKFIVNNSGTEEAAFLKQHMAWRAIAVTGVATDHV
jgi:hypothetical protein